MRGDKMIIKKCQACKKAFLTSRDKAKYCSIQCAGVQKNPVNNQQIKAILQIIYKACNNKMPSGTYTNIALIYGLSRERIRQLAVKVEIPNITPKTYFYVCEICGKTIEERTKKKRHICSVECRNEKAKRYLKTHTVEGKCKNCGNTFSYFKGKWDLTRSFCSKQCQGYALAKESGFVPQSHQLNYLNNKKLRKINDLLFDAPTKTIDGKQMFDKEKLLKFLAQKINA